MAVATAANLPPDGFEVIFVYDDALTERMLAAATVHLGKSEDILLEDVGIYLVSHPNVASLRRLLRFGGESFVEFLQTADDVPRRARLAVPELDLPSLEVEEHGPGAFTIVSRWHRPGFGHVLAGMLRTLADDYGALALLEHGGLDGPCERLEVRVLEESYNPARPFALATGAAAP
jgi:hypothetical protein